MHGRPRRAPTVAESAASAAKSAKLRDLQTQLMHNHQNKLYTKDAVFTSAKLLEINPEVYTAWNYRKLALQHNLEGLGDAEIVKSLVDDELRTVEMALRWNPKSYGPWHHRKWILSQQLSEADFGREFRLLDQLLKADPRNFHGWNYRRFIAKLKNVSEVEELKFTMDMINTNFSNYSAWHNRSALLSQLLKQKAEGFDTKENILTEEYELVRQALFTDPSDQSGWFYHLWLLDQTVTLDYPLLISSWPSQGSDWVLSINVNCFKLSPSVSSNCHYSLDMGTLPIILYFNQAVSGVNSSTVTVNSIFHKNEELIWRPLTTNKSRETHCWVTDLKISDAEFENSKSSTVEVSIGHSRGIISSSGSHYPHTLQLKFTITVKSIYKETTEEPVEELVMWNGVKKELVHENASEIYFDKLSITKEHEPRVSKWNLETLSNEIELFKELSEENCKFVNLTLARLLSAEDSVTSQGNILMHKRTHSQEVLELFNHLVKLDPSHARYYEDKRSLLIMNQSTFDVKAIMKHSLQSSELTPVSLRHAGLRFSRLSLTRIGCVEHLLWIQTIDLSHNELRSITGYSLNPRFQYSSNATVDNEVLSGFKHVVERMEPDVMKQLDIHREVELYRMKLGVFYSEKTRIAATKYTPGLEALQLLVCLNLSHNRISSFTALEPLKLLKSLKILNISSNEIGSHPVDTSRYLCSSPLSHTNDVKHIIEEFKMNNFKVGDYWEAILLFKELNLTQLDITGNAVVDKAFRDLLPKVLPTLKWLDGICI